MILQARSRGRGRGAPAPPRNFQIWMKFCYKSGILLTKMNSSQWKLWFPSVVNHSEIMYCSSSVQFGIVERNEIVFLLCQKQPTALKYLLIFHQKRHKQNGSKCTNGNLWSWPLGLYWFPKRSAIVKYTTVQEKNFSAFILKVLQSLHKSVRKKKTERDNGLCSVYSECTCVDVMYFVPACTIWKYTGFIMALHHR